MTKLTAEKTFDKVAVAQSVADLPADFSILDLDGRVDQLVERIRQHNSL